MIVVDTTVWIEFFGGSGSRFDLHLAELIETGAAIALTDLIYCESLQGIREDRAFARVRRMLLRYPILQRASSTLSRSPRRFTGTAVNAA